VKFDYYILNSYVPAADGDGPELYRRWLEQVQTAEELGFGCAWFTEHHFELFGGMMPNPQLFMAAATQRTRRIHLGTSVILLPLHHPLRIAEDTAMLDVLSHGRLEVGVGRGMPHTPFALFGANPPTVQQQLEEEIAILRTAWCQETFTWEGQFLRCSEPVTVRPRPVQQPHPPLWMTASRDPAHARWIGQQRMSLMTLPWNLPSFDITRTLITEFRAGLHEAGLDERDREVLAMYPAYVGATPERARAEVSEHWSAFRQMGAALESGVGVIDRESLPYEQVVRETRTVFGDAAMCRGHVDRIRSELDVDRLALLFHFGGLSQERVLASMRLFMERVAPAYVSEPIDSARMVQA